jgi:hypothetical protein
MTTAPPATATLPPAPPAPPDVGQVSPCATEFGAPAPPFAVTSAVLPSDKVVLVPLPPESGNVGPPLPTTSLYV